MIRRLEVLVISVVLIVAAFSTGLAYLFYLVYLGILVVGGSYVLTRLGLADLEAGYAVSRLNGHVGDELRVTYTVRHVGRIPKPWLEIHNPTDLPTGLPARAITLPGKTERSWLVRLPLSRRGTFTVDPLLIRTGDPFGLFESSASVGDGVDVTVYPRIEQLPLWRLPSANLEGAHAAPERTLQTTPLATSIRPWAPGDSFNRIHWKSTARHGEIQVKEFDLEQTADVWAVLDLDASVQAGEGEESTVEVGVRAAASVADRAILENRALGVTINASHQTVLQADRGGRQRTKVMQLLAAVEGDGANPLAEALITTLPRLRSGMTAVVITPSLDRSWVRPLGMLRGQGVSCVVIALDRLSFVESAARHAWPPTAVSEEERQAAADGMRALRHAVAEYGLPFHVVPAGVPLAEALRS